MPGQDEASDLGTEQLPEPAADSKQQHNDTAGGGKQEAHVSIKAAGDGKQEASVSVKAASADEYDLRRPPAGKVWRHTHMRHYKELQSLCRSDTFVALFSRLLTGPWPRLAQELGHPCTCSPHRHSVASVAACDQRFHDSQPPMPLRSVSGSSIDMPTKPVAPSVLGHSAAVPAEVRSSKWRLPLRCLDHSVLCTPAVVARGYAWVTHMLSGLR